MLTTHCFNMSKCCRISKEALNVIFIVFLFLFCLTQPGIELTKFNTQLQACNQLLHWGSLLIWQIPYQHVT
jgi:hypothetical protein